MKSYQVGRLLAYVTGLVNQELLLQVEYLAAENRILRAHAPTRLRLSNAERSTLAEIGKRLGRKGLAKVAQVAKPETILGWFRKLVAQKFDGSKHRSYPGRPRIDGEVEALIVQMARDNSGWGYDRIVGALANLGHAVSDQTVGNVLRRHGIAPAPERGQTTAWKDFIAAHMAVLAGMDFFTAEVLTWRGLATYYVLFVIQLESRRVTLAGITRHPTEEWMEQVARNLTDADNGALLGQRYLLHDRDTKFCVGFRSILRDGGVEPLRLPPSSPDLNAFAERWVRTVKEECLSKLILFGERALQRAIAEFIQHYHTERNHQGKENRLLFAWQAPPTSLNRGVIQCQERLGGLLKYYHRLAA
jgi:transposase InsO family protein